MTKPRMDAAYAAGLIDGEGCISIWTTVRSRSSSPQVDIGMTVKAKPILEAFQLDFGGSLKMHRAATERWAEAWMWKAHGADAVNLLRHCRGFLVLKAKQCELALEVWRLKENLQSRPNGQREWDEASTARCHEIADMVKALNAKGPGGEELAASVVGDTEMSMTAQAVLSNVLGCTPSGRAWPTSGLWRSNGGFSTLEASEFPSDADGSSWSLGSILERDPDPRFLLTPKACAGILRRSAERGRSIPLELRAALEAQADCPGSSVS